MIEEYVVVNNKVIVKDDKLGLLDSIEYNDNINEIFKKKNIIEVLEKDLEKAKERLETEKESEKSKKKLIPIPFLSILSCVVIAGIIFIVLGSTISVFNSVFNTFIGNLNFIEFYLLTIGSVFSLIGFSASLDIKLEHNEQLRVIKGLENEVKELTKQLKDNKEKLEELEKNSSYSNTINEGKIKVNHLEELRNIRDIVKALYKMGYNEKKYIKYFNKGILDQKLNNDFKDEDIKEYITNEIKQKIKKLTNSN